MDFQNVLVYAVITVLMAYFHIGTKFTGANSFS